jgi:hypothetical protein
MAAIKHSSVKKRSGRKRLIALGCICVLYLALALSYSFLTPAWEANDEADHTMYVEYIVKHHHLPRISLANGHESHQPPLYYGALAIWQKVLRIPSFQPDLTPAPNVPVLGPSVHPELPLAHHYDTAQKKEAYWLHELRLFSIICGLGTVIFTFLAVNILTKRLDLSAATTLFVVLLPKQLVISSVVTNDSLVVMLCAALFYLAMRLCASGTEKLRLNCLLMGAVGGAATLTKLNSLPLVVLLLPLLALYLYKNKKSHFLSGSLLYGGGFLLVCGWWLIFNWGAYGDPLAQAASNNYLIPAIPGLIKPVSWFNDQRFLHFMPSQLHVTVWYDAGWNQLILPIWMNTALWLLTFISFAFAGLHAIRHFTTWNNVKKWSLAFATLAVFAGLLTTYIIARTTVQAEGRVAYIGLSAFAFLCVTGLTVLCARLAPRLRLVGLMAWPLAFALVNVYVFLHILIPVHAL